MTDHEREFNDDVGLSDDGSAVIRPEGARVAVGAGTLTVTFTATARGDVIPAPELTTYGFPVTRTFTIKEGNNSGIVQYDLIENGKVVWHGLGTDAVEGLLKIIIHQTEGPDPDFPEE